MKEKYNGHTYQWYQDREIKFIAEIRILKKQLILLNKKLEIERKKNYNYSHASRNYSYVTTKKNNPKKSKIYQ